MSEPDGDDRERDETGHRVPLSPALGRRAGIDLLDALGTTRSIRRFTDEPVNEADLAVMLLAATRAPTGSNRQNARFVVLRDGPVARRAKALLGEAAQAMWDDKRVGDGYDRGSGTDAASPKARMAAVMADFVAGIERVPVVVIPCLVRHREPTPTEGASVYPAVQNLLLAARGLGYGGVLTMFQGLVEDELRSLLGVPDEVAMCATVALGRPVGGHGPVRRRPVADVVFDDAWGERAEWVHEAPDAAHSAFDPS